MKAPRERWRCADRLASAAVVVVFVGALVAFGVVLNEKLGEVRAAGLPRSPATMQPG